MNKSELRKMLALLQQARDQVKVWPDDGPEVSIPNTYSPAKQAALIEASPLHSSLQSFHKICLKTAFFPAEDQMETVIEIAQKQFVGKIPIRFVVEYLLWFQPQFTAIRYRLARAVQPMGKKLDPLAATIGAVRLHDKACGAAAAQHLSETVIKAFQEDDKNTLARVKKLSTTPMRNHRNFQIWLAIEALIKRQAGSPNTPMPSTADVRRYIEKHAKDPSFDDLPGPKDHKGWTRLWQDSGAEMIIPKGVRGKKD